MRFHLTIFTSWILLNPFQIFHFHCFFHLFIFSLVFLIFCQFVICWFSSILPFLGFILFFFYFSILHLCHSVNTIFCCFYFFYFNLQLWSILRQNYWRSVLRNSINTILPIQINKFQMVKTITTKFHSQTFSQHKSVIRISSQCDPELWTESLPPTTIKHSRSDPFTSNSVWEK